MLKKSVDRLRPAQLAGLLAVGIGDNCATSANEHDVVPKPANCPVDDEVGPFRAGDRLEQLEILGEIGRGGMCIVYKAMDSSLKRMVALKVLRASLVQAPSVAKRFHRESILAANLAHPNIVPIFSHGHQPPLPPYFTMELVDGCTVKDEVDRLGRLEPAEAIRIAVAAAKALQFAHEHGIIHRDVTPRNIMLQGSDRHVRIADFGIACDSTGVLAEVTQTEGLTFGTPAFMSPEQNLGRPVDKRTDVYSLGATLYYSLTGRLPYSATNRAELSLAFQSDPPEPPSAANPSVRADLDSVVMKMIAVQPQDRYPSCTAAAGALTRCLAVTDGYASSRWTQPSKSLAIAGFVIAAACLVAFVAWLLVKRDGGGLRYDPSASAVERRSKDSSTVQTGAHGVYPRKAPPPEGNHPPNEPGQSIFPNDQPRQNQETAAIAPSKGAIPGRRTYPVVQWVYQPRAGKDFTASNAIRGQSTLRDDGEHAGMYLFDPDKGLIPFASHILETVDFRIERAPQGMKMIRDAPDDAAGCTVRLDPEAFDEATTPASGFSTYYSHNLSIGLVVLFRCAKGGSAKLIVSGLTSPGPESATTQ